MPWPFDREYMQLALLAGLVVGACAPLIGGFLVQRRMSLMGDGIGHLAFAGVAVGRLRMRAGTSGDLALSLFFYGGIAGGVVMTGAAGSLDASVFSYLFGSIITVRASDVLVVAALGALILLSVSVAG